MPRTLTALQVLDYIKRSGSHLVLVVDEYGGIEGLLTHHDVLEAMPATCRLAKPARRSKAVQRADGSWLVDGMIPVDDFKEIFNLDSLPRRKKRRLSNLGRFYFYQDGSCPDGIGIL